MYYIKRAVARVYGIVFSYYHKNRAKKIIAEITRNQKGKWVPGSDD